VRKVLVIANYKKSFGGISGVVDTLLTNFKESEGLKLNLYNTKKNPFLRFFLIFNLLQKGKPYNVFHIHGCSHLGFFPIIIGVIAGKILGKRIIVTYHGGMLEDFIKKYSGFVKYFLSKSDTLTVPSTFLVNILEERGLEVEYLPNIVRLNNVSFKKRNIISPSLIITRSFEKVYNIPFAIRSFKEIQKIYPDALLRLVGSGSLESELKKLVKELDLRNVTFTGRVSNDRIGEELNKADIFINPTTVDNMPISLFEAFACGLPVLSTNVGGLPTFIEHEVNGLLIDSGNENQLVENIQFIMNNNQKAQCMINNGYNTFLKYSFESLKNNYIKLYE
jgi:glycosyltransferase involved in cell wall biosynthesis